MKAAVATDKGLEIRDIPQPKPKPNEVLVRVRAAGLNRADLNAARGVGGHGGASARRSGSTGRAKWSRSATRSKAASRPATA